MFKHSWLETLGLCVGLVALPMSGQTQGAADIRMQLTNIHYRQFSTLDEYLSKSRVVASLLPKLAAFYAQGAATIKRLEKEHAGNPEFVRTAEFYASLNAKDQEGFRVLRREIAMSEQLAHVPLPERQVFYERNIVPLHAEEDRISTVEVSMARQAKSNGIALPEDVEKALDTR